MDNISGLEPGAKVRWAMATEADVEVRGKVAVLSRDGRTLQMEISGVVDLDDWSVSDLGVPAAELDKPNPGSIMLTFTAVAPSDGKLDLRVRLTPETADPVPDDTWWAGFESRMLDTIVVAAP
ncbi:MAG: hypothetical protein RI573_17235 [Balneolaceae bacterium]|nr:hypothetical protein [Balneolaceae bacterium]